MRRYTAGWVLALLAVANAGCPAPTSGPTARGNDDEKALRETFATLQHAVEKDDAEQVLALFDEESRAKLERAAKDKSKSVRDYLKDDLLAGHPYDEYPEG